MTAASLRFPQRRRNPGGLRAQIRQRDGFTGESTSSLITRVQLARGRRRAVILQYAMKAALPLAASLDDLVGARQDRGRDRQPECGRCLQVDSKLVMGRLFDRQIARCGAVEYLRDVMRHSTP